MILWTGCVRRSPRGSEAAAKPGEAGNVQLLHSIYQAIIDEDFESFANMLAEEVDLEIIGTPSVPFWSSLAGSQSDQRPPMRDQFRRWTSSPRTSPVVRETRWSSADVSAVTLTKRPRRGYRRRVSSVQYLRGWEADPRVSLSPYAADPHFAHWPYAGSRRLVHPGTVGVPPSSALRVRLRRS